jgi:hypothetical protein
MRMRNLAVVSLGLALAVFGLSSLVQSVLGQSVPGASQQVSPAPVKDAGQDQPSSDNPTAVVPKLELTPDANGKLSQEQMQALLRVVADKDIENDKLQRDYTYIERDMEKRLDGKGQTKSTETKTYEVLEIYGEQVERLIEKNDKPLDAKEAAKEEEKIQKIMDKRKNESEAERKKRTEREEKDHEEERKFLTEVADAYNFTLVGTESLGGRDTWVIDGEPRPGFEPHMKYANLLPKIHGRVWIDRQDLQLAKMDVEALDTLSFGVVLARFHKGTHIILEQTRVNNEVWLPLHVAFKVDVRVALVKDFHVDGDQTFRDYKKFRTSAKIVGMQEVKADQK